MTKTPIVFDKRLKDDEYFDEIRISIVPRFKTSGLSGDEWRRSAHVEIRRKGQTLWERSWLNLEVAVAFLAGNLIQAGEEIVHTDKRLMCMQPGCSKLATVSYRLKHIYHQGHIVDDDGFEYRRHFCDEHAHRGDSDYEDSDGNYELIGGNTPDAANIPPDVISKSKTIILDPDEWDDED